MTLIRKIYQIKLKDCSARKMNFERFIGCQFDAIKEHLPPYTLSKNDFELKLDEGIEECFYVHAQDESFEMILNKDQVIETIFLSPKNNGQFDFKKYNITTTRQEVLQQQGKPSKSSEPLDIPILGRKGGYDRYDGTISLHFEYKADEAQTLSKITLMSLSAMP